LTVIVQHDPGCKWARLGAEAEISGDGRVTGVRNAGAGHSDAARRFSDTYNLHRAAGTTAGWIAVAYADGSGGQDVYEFRAAAVESLWPYEDRYFYCTLEQPSMTVCAAESVLRWRRVMSEIETPDRDYQGGGLEVIPRLANEDQEAQIQAVRTGRGFLALGHKKG
jgi:hypothetical protein